jgi:hypothetical protein
MTRTAMRARKDKFPARQTSHFLVLLYNNRIAEVQANIR